MTHSLLTKPLVAATGLLFSAIALAGPWTVVPETSSVGFLGTQQGTKFNGRFRTFTATLDLDVADPTKGSIVGVVKLDSVNTRDQDRDSALLDRDWFNVAEHPEARFESQTITKGADGSYEAAGQLTLKGQTKPVVMKFTLTGDAAAAQFAGNFSINRFDFNVGEGWNDTSWVAEQVTVEVKLDLKP